jgi:UDP-N-acetylglucosamine 2-epimerase (non-hydrolysing)
MAPVVNEFKRNNSIITKVCVTAQHREMLDQVLSFFDITPDYDLDLMKPNQNLNQLSSRILMKIDEVLEDFNPDLVLVYGDTTTSSIVALASYHQNIKVGYVEAGLRRYNKKASFPEEVNRQITAIIADYNFALTASSKDNLLEEKINSNTIEVNGNTVVDALFLADNKLKKDYSNPEIEELKIRLDFSKKIILVTGHQRESFGENFLKICNAISKISERDDVQIVYPIHLNPNFQKPVFSILNNNSNILLMPPLMYPSFIWLLKKSFLIITDSAGVQEEVSTFGIPLLITREDSERKETINLGFSKIVGADKEKIIVEANTILDDFKGFKDIFNPYGDGKASNRIMNFILKK